MCVSEQVGLGAELKKYMTEKEAFKMILKDEWNLGKKEGIRKKCLEGRQTSYEPIHEKLGGT